MKTPSLKSFSQDSISRGLLPGTQVLHISEVPVSEFTESNFCFRGSNPDDTAWRIVRLRLANNIPMCLETVRPAGDPALKVRRMSSDRRGVIIELAESIYRGDRYEFASTARRRDPH